MELKVLKGHGASVLSAVFSPDGRQMPTASDNTTARLWNVSRVNTPSEGVKLAFVEQSRLLSEDERRSYQVGPVSGDPPPAVSGNGPVTPCDRLAADPLDPLRTVAVGEVREALEQFEPLWDEVFPAEQARIVQLLVDRVDVSVEGVDIRLQIDGLAGLYREVAGIGRRAIKAA